MLDNSATSLSNLPDRLEPCFQAILVMYKMLPADSESLHSLTKIFREHPDLAQYFSLILYDNSPESHLLDVRLDFSFSYRHDPGNSGLAAAYNYALSVAEEKGCSWLLLLDQDTYLTYDFIVELISSAVQVSKQPEVASIVPKLLINDRIESPVTYYLYQVRHQFHGSKAVHYGVSEDVVGAQQRRLLAYNSGATLRVSALRSIGGFPDEYWLDYLDHVVFDRLWTQGCSMYIMRAILKHHASQADQKSVPAWRQRNLLFAQTRFVKQTGNFFDRLLYRLSLLRSCKGLFLYYPDKRLWKETALQALLLRDHGNPLLSRPPR